MRERAGATQRSSPRYGASVLAVRIAWRRIVEEARRHAAGAAAGDPQGYGALAPHTSVGTAVAANQSILGLHGGRSTGSSSSA